MCQSSGAKAVGSDNSPKYCGNHSRTLSAAHSAPPRKNGRKHRKTTPARRIRVAAGIVLQHNPPKSDRIDASQRTNVKYHERTSEMVWPGSMNELGTSSAEIIHRLHFVSTELADEAYAPRSARHWRVQGSSPCERRPDRHA